MQYVSRCLHHCCTLPFTCTYNTPSPVAAIASPSTPIYSHLNSNYGIDGLESALAVLRAIPVAEYESFVIQLIQRLSTRQLVSFSNSNSNTNTTLFACNYFALLTYHAQANVLHLLSSLPAQLRQLLSQYYNNATTTKLIQIIFPSESILALLVQYIEDVQQLYNAKINEAHSQHSQQKLATTHHRNYLAICLAQRDVLLTSAKEIMNKVQSFQVAEEREGVDNGSAEENRMHSKDSSSDLSYPVETEIDERQCWRTFDAICQIEWLRIAKAESYEERRKKTARKRKMNEIQRPVIPVVVIDAPLPKVAQKAPTVIIDMDIEEESSRSNKKAASKSPEIIMDFKETSMRASSTQQLPAPAQPHTEPVIFLTNMPTVESSLEDVCIYLRNTLTSTCTAASANLVLRTVLLPRLVSLNNAAPVLLVDTLTIIVKLHTSAFFTSCLQPLITPSSIGTLSIHQAFILTHCALQSTTINDEVCSLVVRILDCTMEAHQISSKVSWSTALLQFLQTTVANTAIQLHTIVSSDSSTLTSSQHDTQTPCQSLIRTMCLLVHNPSQTTTSPAPSLRDSLKFAQLFKTILERYRAVCVPFKNELDIAAQSLTSFLKKIIVRMIEQL